MRVRKGGQLQNHDYIPNRRPQCGPWQGAVKTETMWVGLEHILEAIQPRLAHNGCMELGEKMNQGRIPGFGVDPPAWMVIQFT